MTETTEYPQLKDDRTDEQKETHCILWGGTDTFLSGWGRAQNCKSYAFWACKPEHESKVLSWVENRSDMQRVRQVASDYKPRGSAFVHIYVVDDEHSAVR